MNTVHVREASASLYNALVKKTDGLVAVQAMDLPGRQPPSSALVVLLCDDKTVPEIPSEWMGFHVSHKLLNKQERKDLAASLRPDVSMSSSGQ